MNRKSCSVCPFTILPWDDVANAETKEQGRKLMNAVIQTRINVAIKARNFRSGRRGLTVSNAVRMLFKRITTEGALPLQPVSINTGYQRSVRAKVLQALEDPCADIAETEARF